ncbi:actin depolymerizing protein [Macrolepiota fuliginosa MF-IS2]|uniref:Twinfilin n=1 Tax=Macrolepiota fuliginosa MF-IS2 TaxID=1400762 RepID=A0A9P5XMS1_9AGAR|nr:actin depolymerizing protein [Macrolepiota fuliginosa MF-IS2]
MSASSGITVTPDLTAAFADALKSDSVRFLKVVIHNESLVHELSLDAAGSFEEDLAKLQDNDIISDNVPAYVLAKLDPPSADWIAFSYVPDSAKVRDKMLYASSRSALLKSLGSTVFTDSIFATSKADLTAEAYQAHLRHLAAPKPLSAREQEMADVRAAESNYEGSRARAAPLGSGVGFRWAPEVEEAITELGRGDNSAIVILTVDPQTETLLLKSSSEITVDQLRSTVPKAEPSYSLFAWPHSYSSPPRRELIFIYSCPSSSPIKHRMLYSSGSGSTLRWIKELLASTAPTAQLASRKIETSEPQELTEEYIIEELGLKDSEDAEDSGGGVGWKSSDVQKPFAKPRGPPKRR